MSKPSTTAESRFWGRVEKSETCWLWTASTNQKGYGRLARMDGTRVSAHRLSYELAYGPIPEGLVIDHLCHVPRCVRPDHLRATTNKRNSENRRGANRNNNSSGVRGVHWHKRECRWHVTVQHFGTMHHGGAFCDLQEAEAAAVALRSRLFGVAA